jgi:chaperonin GroEL
MCPLYCKNGPQTIGNAAPIAGLMLTTEALVADIKEDDKKSAAGGGGGMPGGGGGMGGMY